MSFAKYLIAALLLMPLLLSAKPIQNLTMEDFKRLRFDAWKVVGRNLILEGHVYIPVEDMELFADRAVINLESKDIEAHGNLEVLRWQAGSVSLSLPELAKLENTSNTVVVETEVSYSFMGSPTYRAKVRTLTDRVTADHFTGNLATGFFQVDNARIRYGTSVAKAERAVRTPDGVLTITNGEVSGCNYLESDSAHYSIAAGNIVITPHKQRFYGMKNIDLDAGDRSIFCTNGWVKIYGVPVLWLPVFYKPKDQSLGLCGVTWAKSTSRGYTLNLSRKIVLPDFPEFSARLLGDFYEKRGFGYGINGSVDYENSRTEFSAYSIYDRNQYCTDSYDRYLLDVPHQRYNFRLANITHITPRLDFRGQFDYSSDFYVRRDFMPSQYSESPQPATYVALEQQFDHFSLAAYMRFRVNDFYTTVEKLPELRLDVPRQEILNTGIYYQGDVSFDNLHMRWIDFDDDYILPGTELKNYSTVRFDTTHFLYYPIHTKYFSLVPRAGMKFTAYSDTSDQDVTSEDLVKMLAASNPQYRGGLFFNNYDDDGGSKGRFAFEFGLEGSTKIHNTWQNLRSSFLMIDGLRHVFQPYFNYTYMPEPNISCDNIYYFDDIDRLCKQNFIRLGMVNRLQTREDGKVKTFFSMENYWDYHFERDDGSSRVGNMGTILRYRIFKGLTFHTQLLLDLSGDGEVHDVIRNGRDVGQVGLACKWINFWHTGITWEPARNWKLSFGYIYNRSYSTPSAYSMGSTLTSVNAGSGFRRYYNVEKEVLAFSGNLPVTPDHRTLGLFRVTYDVRQGSIDVIQFGITRAFHCWQLIAGLGLERNYSSGDSMWDINYTISANLTGLNNLVSSDVNTVLQQMQSLKDNPGVFSFL